MNTSSSIHTLIPINGLVCHSRYIGSDELRRIITLLQDRYPLVQPELQRSQKTQKRALEDHPVKNSSRSTKRRKIANSQEPTPTQSETEIEDTREVQVIQHKLEFQCKAERTGNYNKTAAVIEAADDFFQELIKRRSMFSNDLVGQRSGDVRIDPTFLIITSLIHSVQPSTGVTQY